MSPVAFGLLALIILGAALVVAFARDARTGVAAVAVALLGAAGLYALLGAPWVAAAQAVLHAGGALAFFMVVRAVRVEPAAARASAVRPARAAVVALAAVGLLAKAQLGGPAPATVPAPATAPATERSPTAMIPAVKPAAPLSAAAVALPVGLALLVVFAAVVGAPTLPRRPRPAVDVDGEEGAA